MGSSLAAALRLGPQAFGGWGAHARAPLRKVKTIRSFPKVSSTARACTIAGCLSRVLALFSPAPGGFASASPQLLEQGQLRPRRRHPACAAKNLGMPKFFIYARVPLQIETAATGKPHRFGGESSFGSSAHVASRW